MIDEKDFESRIEYLLAVLVQWMEQAGMDQTVEYDETSCDGYCLLEDMKWEITILLDT